MCAVIWSADRLCRTDSRTDRSGRRAGGFRRAARAHTKPVECVVESQCHYTNHLDLTSAEATSTCTGLGPPDEPTWLDPSDLARIILLCSLTPVFST